MQPRRFPAPWSCERTPSGWLIRDAASEILAYVYEESESYRSSGSIALLPEQADLVAQAIAALPVFMGQAGLLPAGLTVPLGPWLTNEGYGIFDVTGHGRVRIATTYFDNPPAGTLTHDEARRIAAGIARIPALLPSSS